MLRVIACVALLTAGCAFDPPPASSVRTKTVTKTVTEFKTRTCHITTVPTSRDEFCARPSQDEGCHEVHRRIFVLDDPLSL